MFLFFEVSSGSSVHLILYSFTRRLVSRSSDVYKSDMCCSIITSDCFPSTPKDNHTTSRYFLLNIHIVHLYVARVSYDREFDF